MKISTVRGVGGVVGGVAGEGKFVGVPNYHSSDWMSNACSGLLPQGSQLSRIAHKTHAFHT